MEPGESPPKRRKGEEGYPGTPQVSDYLYPGPSYFNNNPASAGDQGMNYGNGGSQHSSTPGTPTFPSYQSTAQTSFNLPPDNKPTQLQLDSSAAQYSMQQQQQQTQQQHHYSNYGTNPMYSNTPVGGGPTSYNMADNQNLQQQQQAPHTMPQHTFKTEDSSSQEATACKEEYPNSGVAASSCSYSDPSSQQQQQNPTNPQMWQQQQYMGFSGPVDGSSGNNTNSQQQQQQQQQQQITPYHSSIGSPGPASAVSMMSSSSPFSSATPMNSYPGGSSSNGYPSPLSSIMPPLNNMQMSGGPTGLGTGSPAPHNPMQDYYGQNHHPQDPYISRTADMYNPHHAGDPFSLPYSESRIKPYGAYNGGDMYSPHMSSGGYGDNALVKHEPGMVNNYMSPMGGYNSMGGNLGGGGLPPQHNPYNNMYGNYNGGGPMHPMHHHPHHPHHQMAPPYQYIPPSPALPLHDQYIQIELRLCQALSHVMFGPPVTHIYNPLDYAMEPHKCYLQKYCQGKKDILFLGMNPGPYGMAQTGVPFGEVKHAKDWLGVSGTVKTPQYEHPKKPILGFDCSRREVSGDRFWGYFKRLCIKPENFFRYALVHNICPLLFMNEKGKNLTPADLKLQERKQLNSICGKALCDIVTLLNTKVVIGVGRFSEERAKVALKDCGIEWVKVTNIMHPSPANPAANKGWDNIIEKQLEDMGLINYFRASKEDIAEEEERIAAEAAAAAAAANNNNNTVESAGAGDSSSNSTTVAGTTASSDGTVPAASSSSPAGTSATASSPPPATDGDNVNATSGPPLMQASAAPPHLQHQQQQYQQQQQPLPPQQAAGSCAVQH